jgi:hypothetical protein
MNFLRSIVALLRGGAPNFSVLEMALLREVEQQLDLDRAKRLRNRIESINLVQRLDGGREVNAYFMKGGKPVFDDRYRLIAEDGEQMLAMFSFRTSNQSAYSGAMWLVYGQLFSIEFDGITEHILEHLPKDVHVRLCV